MIDLYDKALLEDLEACLGSSVSRIYKSEQYEEVVATLKNDKIDFPVVFLDRHPYSVDTRRLNFLYQTTGICAGFNKETHCYIWVKTIPINLTYSMFVLAEKQITLDDMVRELLFDRMERYFIPIRLPFGIDRYIRVGVAFSNDTIEQKTFQADHMQSGKWYEVEIPIEIHGANLFDVVEIPMLRTSFETGFVERGRKEIQLGETY